VAVVAASEPIDAVSDLTWRALAARFGLP
jgi:hypothetical protein